LVLLCLLWVWIFFHGTRFWIIRCAIGIQISQVLRSVFSNSQILLNHFHFWILGRESHLPLFF
jgi:hypothetical protein